QLYISRDITYTSSSTAKVMSYYLATASIARNIAILFKAVMPEYYEKYRKAFDAGVWFTDDPGPFIGRAIIYKLQGQLHRDRQDVGPSVCFPVGDYSGGEMLFPQLGSKFTYDPGSVFIFFSSNLYHKVNTFKPKVQTAEQAKVNITPGRIGSVFFFPKQSYKVLKDKPKDWARQTDYDSKN
ncbi:hypothetical protein BDN70DRAFT_821347, partial [Pholiota conissans]